MIPDWRLPAGVDRGLWDYLHSGEMVERYDGNLAGSPLLTADLRFVKRWFVRPGRLVDLGCGTGRLVVEFAKHGFECLGVDLSRLMLDETRRKAEQAGVSVDLLEANLVELDQLASADFDYAACLFSTLGMIRGRENRQRFLGHVQRVLKPGGVFALHVHNARFRGGVGLGKRGAEKGDRTMPQAYGGAALTLHHFSRREIETDLKEAGFEITRIEPVSLRADGRLRWPWLLTAWRAYGYLICARRGPGRVFASRA